jgi:hypothetical protein
MFVGERELTDVLDKARSALASHAQFEAWGAGANEQELRATVRWPGDDRRYAELNVFFAHLPKAT